MKLYVDPITVNCRKVLAGFDLLEVEYDRVLVDTLHAVLPALVDDEVFLCEPNAILQYAADRADHSTYYPADRATRTEIHRWMLWESSSWFPSCYTLMVEGAVKPLLGQAVDQRMLDDQVKNFQRLAHTLDLRLAQNPWLCGEQLTLADLVVAAPLHLHPYEKLSIDGHVHLKHWMDEQISVLPCWNEMHQRSSLDRRNREGLTMLMLDN